MRRLVAAIAAATLLAGCGTPAADLFVVQRTGSIPGAALRLRVSDDGQVMCNGRRHELSSKLLISARVLVQDLHDPAQAGTTLPARRDSILRYSIRDEDGMVAFSDSSPRQPAVFYRAALLVRQIAQRACGLPR